MLEMNPRLPTREVSISLTLRDLAMPLFRGKRVLIATFLVVFAIAALLGLLFFHKYESHMEILVSRERLDPVGTTTNGASQAGPAPALTYREVESDGALVTTRDLLEQVVLANGLQNRHAGILFKFFHPRQTEADRVARAMQALGSQIQVEVAPETNLVKVTYSSSDPAQSYGVLKSLSNIYLAKHEAIHRPPGSNPYLVQQVQSYKAALAEAEAGLRAFGQPGAAEPDKERAEVAQQLTDAVGETNTIEQAIAADEQRVESDQEQLKGTPPALSTRQDSHAANLQLQTLRARLLAAETARTDLLVNHVPGDPLVKWADQEVAEAKAAIVEARQHPDVNQPADRDPSLESLQDNLARDEADLERQKASLAANQGGIETMRSQMEKLGSQSSGETDSEREAREQDYLRALSLKGQEQTSGGLGRTRTESVAIAVPPEIPVRPSHRLALILLVALAVATLVSLLTTYMVDYFDPSFRTPAEVIDILGVGVVVALPKRIA
jgi:uncharacterized protein involved in exopolysaccharide biosynthesis